MKHALQRLVSSLKFWTLIIGAIATWSGAWLARHGFDMSDAHVEQLAQYLALGFGLLLGAQGLQDHGKEAAKLKGPTVEGVGGNVEMTVVTQPEAP